MRLLIVKNVNEVGKWSAYYVAKKILEFKAQRKTFV